jgi:hypothetical protein
MKNYEIKLTSARGSFTISPRSACKLVAGGLSGFDSSGFDVSVSPFAALQGGVATRRRFATRELSLTFEIDAVGDEADAIRRDIVSMMDPREDIELCVNLGGACRKITVIPYGRADFSRATLCDRVLVTLRFVAPAVFFTDEAGKRVRFHEVAPLFTFPMNFISGAGTVTGFYRVSDGADVTNRGDGECGIVAKIRASGGSVVNPGIRLGEKFVRLNAVLSDGDEVVIDTRPKMKRVSVNGRRVFTFDRDSEFFSLPAGENRLCITADSGGEFMDAEIEFHEVYFGA